MLLKSYNDCGLDHLLLLVWVIYTLVWTIYTLVYHVGLAPPSMQRFWSRSDHENVHATECAFALESRVDSGTPGVAGDNLS